MVSEVTQATKEVLTGKKKIKQSHRRVVQGEDGYKLEPEQEVACTIEEAVS